VLAPNFGNTAQAGGQHYGHQPMAGAVPLRAPEAEEPPLQLTAAQATHGAQPLVAQSGAHGGGALGQLRAAPRGGLFSPDPEAVMSGHPPMHAPEPPRRNIFQAVTGRLRNTLSAATMPPQADHGRGEPIPEEQHQPQHQEPRASVRHAASEEMGLEIPAFLRRQNS
jgi:cell division protein FtsZ